MRLTDFRVLTFDCYGTLIDWETGLLDRLRPWLAREGRTIGDDEVLAAFASAEAQAETEQPGKRYPQILEMVLSALACRWAVTASSEDRTRFGASVGLWPAFSDTTAALRSLQRYYRLAILSNVDRTSFAASNVRLGVGFDHVFTAEDIGSYKPDRRNFEYALAKLRAAGIEGNRVLHVAQSLFHDHVPAKNMGMATVWIDRRAGKTGAGATPPAEARPDWRFESLQAFAEAVEQSRKEP